jgi:hypothetical protein
MKMSDSIFSAVERSSMNCMRPSGGRPTPVLQHAGSIAMFAAIRRA